MRKLLDLFSQFVETKDYGIITGVGISKEEGYITNFSIEYIDKDDDEENTKYISAYKLVSKKYGFIKYLLENKKIDLVSMTCKNPQHTEILDSDYSWEERILMILSIQDNPIEFLISILK